MLLGGLNPGPNTEKPWPSSVEPEGLMDDQGSRGGLLEHTKLKNPHDLRKHIISTRYKFVILPVLLAIEGS